MGSDRFWIESQKPGLPYVVMLPGWAHDWRTMSRCEFKANRIFISGLMLPGVVCELAEFLSEAELGPAAVLGWSLGGFAAVEFTNAFPELVDRLILVGIRRSYTQDEIKQSKLELKQNRKGFLEGFYRRNFLPAQRRDWPVFKNELMDAYMSEMGMIELLAGLDYLGASQIDERALGVCPILIVHGRQDVIAPVQDAISLASGSEIRIIENASHAAFMHPDFPGIIEEWLR